MSVQSCHTVREDDLKQKLMTLYQKYELLFRLFFLYFVKCILDFVHKMHISWMMYAFFSEMHTSYSERKSFCGS